MTNKELHDKINQAASVIGTTWPLYSFVTGNPLAGFEDKPFLEALKLGNNLFGGNMLPEARVYRKAWEDGDIDNEVIVQSLSQYDKSITVEQSLKQMEARNTCNCINETHELDRITVKWLSLFMDEGMAAWPMPFREMGFYTAWRKLIVHDEDIKKKMDKQIPLKPEEALTALLKDIDEKNYIEIFEKHLTALPGWVGYIKYRVEKNTIWNEAYPITLVDFLAVRLWMASCLEMPIYTSKKKESSNSILDLQYIWLQAWEQSWQNKFIKRINQSHILSQNEENQTSAKAQFVFCLDTRSELLRRNIEKIGNYETFGSAGAFGLPMNYQDPETGLVFKSSPAMQPSQYLVHEHIIKNKEAEATVYSKKNGQLKDLRYFFKRMKNILPSAFGFVEGTGLYYGSLLLLRLYKPNTGKRLLLHQNKGGEKVFEPQICHTDHNNLVEEISEEEKAQLLKGVFESCGWNNFAPLVIFTGHASRSANNPFASSLDCGACAGNPGKRNARTLAKIANNKVVQKILSEKYNIVIPDDTLFIAAEHITSSDEVILFDENIADNHKSILIQVKNDLELVKKEVTKERLKVPNNADILALKKSNNWAESRPEWGLSGHTGYIIGPRGITRGGEFSDCFLSSYDWQLDNDGSILKGIMQGPLVVVQWIANHYYFSTVDNDLFGSGSKITQNVTGKFGVVQGNGGDLKVGLPLQSLMKSDIEVFHKPIRINVLIQAPKRFIDKILTVDDKLKNLIDNCWVHLLIMDPENMNEIKPYQ